MTDTEPIADLAQVRWTTRLALDSDDPVDPSQGWHVIGQVGDDPDPHSREMFDLYVENAHDGDGGDCSAWLADMVARKLTESDNGWRASWQRAVYKVNRAGFAIHQALAVLEKVEGFYPHDEQAVEEARALLAPHARIVTPDRLEPR